MGSRTTASQVRQTLIDLVQRPYTPQLVAAYFDANRGFAGAMFDGLDASGALANNPVERFVADDIAAASLLDVRFGPPAVRELLTSPKIHDALAAVPRTATLWDADPETLVAATNLWSSVRGLEGVGVTRTSKLLARKRPLLVPIVDSVILRALHLGNDVWGPLKDALNDRGLRQEISSMRPTSVAEGIGVLRLLDVMVWMSFSRSQSAVRVQQEIGAPTSRVLP